MHFRNDGYYVYKNNDVKGTRYEVLFFGEKYSCYHPYRVPLNTGNFKAILQMLFIADGMNSIDPKELVSKSNISPYIFCDGKVFMFFNAADNLILKFYCTKINDGFLVDMFLEDPKTHSTIKQIWEKANFVFTKNLPETNIADEWVPFP